MCVGRVMQGQKIGRNRHDLSVFPESCKDPFEAPKGVRHQDTAEMISIVLLHIQIVADYLESSTTH